MNWDWIKRHRFMLFLLSLFLLLCVPLIIHIIFKIPSEHSFITPEWSAGELLSYYGAILAFLGTVFLGALALYQNDLFKKQNDKIMQLQNVPYFSYVDLEFTGQVVKSTNDHNCPPGFYLIERAANKFLFCSFDANNMSNYPICFIKATLQGFDSLSNRWISVTGDPAPVSKTITIPPGQEHTVYIGYSSPWAIFEIIGVSDQLCGIELEFINTNGLSTRGRIVFYKDNRPCKYQLIPLPIEVDVDSTDD